MEDFLIYYSRNILSPQSRPSSRGLRAENSEIAKLFLVLYCQDFNKECWHHSVNTSRFTKISSENLLTPSGGQFGCHIHGVIAILLNYLYWRNGAPVNYFTASKHYKVPVLNLASQPRKSGQSLAALQLCGDIWYLDINVNKQSISALL